MAADPPGCTSLMLAAVAAATPRVGWKDGSELANGRCEVRSCEAPRATVPASPPANLLSEKKVKKNKKKGEKKEENSKK